MSIQFIDLAAQQSRIREKLDKRIADVLDHGKYIMGPEVAELEQQLSAFSGAKHAITCANGTDALQIALMAIGVKAGDAVFCPSFTFAATAEIVPLLGATPVFIDVNASDFNIDTESLINAIAGAKALGLRPAGVIPVDLFGLPASYNEIQEIADEHNLWVLSDSAQGFGSTYNGQRAGSLGDVATTSFFPAKPLGCYGDGGAVFTSSDELAALIKSFRVHGKGTHKYDNERIGVNSRLDTLQAAILLEKLAVYDAEIEARQAVALRYNEGLSDLIETPYVSNDKVSVWAQYTLKTPEGMDRAKIMDGLKNKGVPSVVYYPMPLHQQTAFQSGIVPSKGLPVSEALSQSVFSLPMHPYLEKEEQDVIIEALRSELR